MRNFIRPAVSPTSASVLLSAVFLCVMFLMLRHDDGIRDGFAMRASETMKRAPELRTAPVAPLANGLDAATRALFTSPSPPPPARGRVAVISAELTRPPSVEVVGRLQLPFERGLIIGDALSLENIGDLLSAEYLPLRIGEYEAESCADPDACALTSLYRQVVERALNTSGTRARLAGFACGLRICVGVLTEGNNLDYWNWTDAFSGSPELSNSGLQTLILSLEGGPSILRFAFSVDQRLTPTE